MSASAAPSADLLTRALGAFWAWAVGTTKAGEELFGLSKDAGELILLAATFLVPIVDEALSKLIPAKP